MLKYCNSFFFVGTIFTCSMKFVENAFVLKFISLLNHGGFLLSQVIVSWGMKFESTLLMVLLRMDNFSLMIFLRKAFSLLNSQINC